MNPFDTSVFHAVNHLAGHVPVLDFLMKSLAQYALEISALIFIVSWFVFPKHEKTYRHALIMAGLAGILALGLNSVIADLWFRARPFVTLPPGTFTTLVSHGADASFPSDHVAGVFAFAAASWGKNRKFISRSFTVLGVLVMIARVYVGVHWPTDVIGGMMVGMIAGRSIWVLSRWVFPISTWLSNHIGFTSSAAQSR